MKKFKVRLKSLFFFLYNKMLEIFEFEVGVGTLNLVLANKRKILLIRPDLGLERQ